MTTSKIEAGSHYKARQTGRVVEVVGQDDRGVTIRFEVGGKPHTGLVRASDFRREFQFFS